MILNPHLDHLQSQFDNTQRVGAEFTSSVVTATTDTPFPQLFVKLLSPKATLPDRATEFAAGFDLISAQYVTVLSQNKAVVFTDIAIAIPPGTYARIAPRSGLAAKKHIL
mgnify:CR=1 FL=1